jgi:hypothetical protein
MKKAAIYCDGFLLYLPVFVDELAFLPRKQNKKLRPSVSH